jgi:hypothetical protein
MDLFPGFGAYAMQLTGGEWSFLLGEQAGGGTGAGLQLSSSSFAVDLLDKDTGVAGHFTDGTVTFDAVDVGVNDYIFKGDDGGGHSIESGYLTGFTAENGSDYVKLVDTFGGTYVLDVRAGTSLLSGARFRDKNGSSGSTAILADNGTAGDFIGTSSQVKLGFGAYPIYVDSGTVRFDNATEVSMGSGHQITSQGLKSGSGSYWINFNDSVGAPTLLDNNGGVWHVEGTATAGEDIVNYTTAAAMIAGASPTLATVLSAGYTSSQYIKISNSGYDAYLGPYNPSAAYFTDGSTSVDLCDGSDAITVNSGYVDFQAASEVVWGADLQITSTGLKNGSPQYWLTLNGGQAVLKDDDNIWHSEGTAVAGEDIVNYSAMVFYSYDLSGALKGTSGNPTGVEGIMTINTADNAIRIYADGAWRDLATWL